MKPFALIGAAALGAGLFLAGFAAALLDGRRGTGQNPVLNPVLYSADAPLRWSDTGEAVETYQTFTYPTGTLHTFTGTIQNGKPVTLRSVS